MKTILLIDDSKPQLLSAKFTLQHGGYRVETVSDPMTALDRIKELQPDLIITDVNMPGKDGITIVREVRQLAPFSTTPLLVMSTDSQKHLLEQARTAGASGWLLKPVKQEDLLATVKKLLSLE
ncbi:two-component system, chemotaxis family, response regulator CheY [Trichlorobacter thiogenes]|uniref:Two-component system, chemotaxis family, response regulator CheY n=1 Tax=Trichlorobacter thiogenes TaxID=115783 RepID=A0A1T4PX49_9BACT|nr:response regulator [Trichlorobacter thiogenes]SJZ95801.1 two-component system, chemotaxis family, response regulator CheY [Trichlorobacter thiogenes]